MFKRPAQRTAPTAEHRNRVLRKRRRAIGRIHVDHIHRSDIDAKMAHLSEKTVVCGGAQRHCDFFADQFTGICFINLKLRTHDAIVVVGIGDSHIEHLQILPS